MSERKPHPTSSLIALAVALVAAHAAGVFGISTAIVGAAVLFLGYARVRGWSLVEHLDRPRAFAALGVGYLLFFMGDILLTGRSNPVPSLGRLVVFLLAAEILSGDARRAHRPVLFGLLLLVSGASLTTDLWFALPLAVFAWTATLSQMGLQLRGPDGAAVGRKATARAALSLTLASLLAGFVFFLLVPRVGSGWARVGVAKDNDQALETGLASSVRLGTLGKVKLRRTVAFRASADRPVADPESIYWRVRSYDEWTGSGWTRADRRNEINVLAYPGEAVPLLPERGAVEPDVVVTLSAVRSDFPAVPIPGRGVWVRTAESGSLLVSPDGTVIPAGGRPTRRMEIGSVLAAARRGAPAADGSGAEIPPSTLDTSGVSAAVTTWAQSVPVRGSDAESVARALVSDLERRSYSLDTRGIDPRDPVGSFLAGAPAHCEYFASALALGLRARGIPARVVGGFLGAEPALFGDDWVVRDSRAHLWTEAFLPDLGWITLDATPSAGRAAPSATLPWIGGLWDRIVVAWDTWVIGLDFRDQFEALLQARDALLAGLLKLADADLGIAALGVAGLAGFGLILWRTRRRASVKGVPALYQQLLRIAARRGLTPAPSESAGEFATRLERPLGDARVVRWVTSLYENERFGGAAPAVDERRAAATALRQLARGLNRRATAAAGS